MQLDISQSSVIKFQNHWAVNWKTSRLENFNLRVTGYVVREIEGTMMM